MKAYRFQPVLSGMFTSLRRKLEPVGDRDPEKNDFWRLSPWTQEGVYITCDVGLDRYYGKLNDESL